jgi:UDP-4-amino-4,6-dideoxy-N-acetyl-beta-L-altrosamine N-acetyltransferase
LIDFGYGVRLTTLESEHLESARVWRNNEKIRKWCRQTDIISLFDQYNWYNRMRADSSIKMYVIETEKGRSKFMPIGVCGLTSIDTHNRRAEFSLYIAPEYQRQGHSKAALKTLLKHGFNNLNLNLIWGETFDGNPAAKMFEQLGFVKEGTRREFYFKEGRYIDAHLYSVKREEVAWNG